MIYDICVFGGCSLDLTYFMNEDGTYNEVPNIVTPGGKASNQAVAASRAGAKTTIITRLGDDENGIKIKQNLIDNNVDVSNVKMISGLNNDICKIYIDKEKDNEIKRVNGAIDSFYPEMVEENKEVLLHSKIVFSQLKMPKEVVIELINFCYENKITLILTPCRPDKLKLPNPINQELIDKVNFITLNQSEFEIIFGDIDYDDILKQYPNKLFITLSHRGMIYYNGEEIIHYDAVQVPIVIDRTGAGDTYKGNFGASLASGCSIDEAIFNAMYACAYKVQSATAQAGMPIKKQLLEFIKNHKQNGLLRKN